MNTLFDSNPKIIQSEKEQEALAEGSDKRYCFEIIAKEEYLWDMRFWKLKKLRKDFTAKEVKDQINKWIEDDKKDGWSNNCGHCLYCIRLLLDLKWATLNQVVKAVIKNDKIKYERRLGK